MYSTSSFAGIFRQSHNKLNVKTLSYLHAFMIQSILQVRSFCENIYSASNFAGIFRQTQNKVHVNNLSFLYVFTIRFILQVRSNKTEQTVPRNPLLKLQLKTKWFEHFAW